jgi:hypothetical protein
MTMKSIIALLATTVLIAGATSAMAYRHPSIQPGAHASAAASSETDIRKQCAEEARARWGTNSQDLQTARDFAASTCIFDHGVRNP